jgi:zinc transport system substrate-binding protein
MRKHRKSWAAAAALTCLAAAPLRAAAEPAVIASIKPIHSLVAQVMDGVGAPSRSTRWWRR